MAHLPRTETKGHVAMQVSKWQMGTSEARTVKSEKMRHIYSAFGNLLLLAAAAAAAATGAQGKETAASPGC